MIRAVERAREIGLDALQVFSDNPAAWARRAAPPKELPAFRARIAELGLGPLAVHASYLINLAGPSQTFFERSCVLLATELQTASSYGASFLNVHIGSHRGTSRQVGIARLAEGIRRVFAEVEDQPGMPMLVLENSAGSGDVLGSSIEEIAAILDEIGARGIPERRVAICLDTAHLWGSGIPISRPEEVDDLIEAVRARLGIERLAMVHFNDSKAALGSFADRHEHIGAGTIGEAGLRALVTHPALRSVPFYLETPGMDDGYDAINASRVADLIAGRPLAELGPEAKVLHANRSGSPPAETEGRGRERSTTKRSPQPEPAPKAASARRKGASGNRLSP